MSILWVIAAILFFVFAVGGMAFARRVGQVKPEPRVTIGAGLATFGAIIIYFWSQFGRFETLVGELTQNVIFITLILLGFYAIVQLFNWSLYEFIVRPRGLKLPRFLFDIIGGAVLGVTLLLLIREFFGTELSGILVTSTIASAIIGLALQDTLGNLVSGISLQIEAPFSIDDWVEIGGHEGQLVSQNWRTLTLLTRENHRVSLTNRFVANDKIVNYSRPTRRQIHNIIVGMELQYPPERVKKILVKVMEDIKEVDPDPYMPAYIAEIGDFAILYGMRYWINDYGEVIYIRNLVLTRLWYVLERENINFAFPTQDLNMRMISPTLEVDSRKRDTAQILEKYRTFSWLEGLNEEQLIQLAENSKLALYTRGEEIVQQGESGDSLFIVIEGMVGVYVNHVNGRKVRANPVETGNFFGEMSLLTGQPRSASVIAEQDVYVAEINQTAFSDLLENDPHILDLFLEGLEKRRSNLLHVLANANEEETRVPGTASRSQLVNRIARYLGIG